MSNIVVQFSYPITFTVKGKEVTDFTRTTDPKEAKLHVEELSSISVLGVTKVDEIDASDLALVNALGFSEPREAITEGRVFGINFYKARKSNLADFRSTFADLLTVTS